MSISIAELREQRLQKLMDDCQQQVVSQIIGPFGLSVAMFAERDKDGGNVTTVHNFEKGVTATEEDQILSDRFRETVSSYDRKNYEVGRGDWKAKRQEKIDKGVDDYRGVKISSADDVDLDHVVPVKKIATDPRIHLGLGKVKDGKADLSEIKKVVNDDRNLAITDGGLNSSKKDHEFEKWSQKVRPDGTTNEKHFGIDAESAREVVSAANEHYESSANSAWEKQKAELLSTGADQAIRMGMRQALGLLLTELVNGLFNEFKVLIKQGVEAGKTLFEEIRQRLARVIESVVKKIPDAVGQMFQGGISGFMSNLLTFLINNFLSTAKRFVTVIREGLLGLFRAFKMIFFPPKHMTGDQALQEGLKILTTVVITAVGLLLNETVATFMATVPFLKPFADLITPVLIGIMTGLLSAFLAYQIDCMFDRMGPSFDEKMLDSLISNSGKHDEYAGALIDSVNSGLRNIELYNQAIVSYQRVGESYGRSALYGASTLSSLRSSLESRVALNTEIDETMALVEERKIKLRNWLDNKGKV
ncbi:hypothetical protein E5198_09410 [Pseudomonas sp. A-1]|uniref:hypothetical protein n=1 Tax=Pseudomonas sp. A-1 TaxID=1821274 RepID=UPI0010A642F3|nr:hypothetical protein [Pseudomonas sp. A-1]THG82313.1 hypothetical protein E5198_09410 [Pseudomonas sp. A-1]